MSEDPNTLEATQPERQLARFTKVLKVEDHPNADTLDILTVYGWQVVSKKGNFKTGDDAVFFEVDSIVPATETFSWLADKNYRIKSIKLRGQLSQGLCIPPMVLASDPGLPGFQFDDTILKYVTKTPHEYFSAFVHDGTVVTYNSDLTEALGVTKFVKPLPAELAGVAKGNFPHFIPKTDQIRCQNLVDEISYAYDNAEKFEVTMKLDGSSFTAYYKDGEIGACTRNLELDLDKCKNRLTQVFEDSGLKYALVAYGKNIAVQCEYMGPGVQGNREKLEKNNLYVYDIYDIDERRYLKPEERIEVFVHLAQVSSGTFQHVPIINPHYHLPSEHIQPLLAFAEGPSISHKIREGIVFKSHSTTFSFKAISNQFLIKEED